MKNYLFKCQGCNFLSATLIVYHNNICLKVAKGSRFQIGVFYALYNAINCNEEKLIESIRFDWLSWICTFSLLVACIQLIKVKPQPTTNWATVGLVVNSIGWLTS